MQRVLFTTEGHIFLQWDSLRSRKRRETAQKKQPHHATHGQSAASNRAKQRPGRGQASEISGRTSVDGGGENSDSDASGTHTGNAVSRRVSQLREREKEAAVRANAPLSPSINDSSDRALSLDRLARSVGNYYATTGSHSIRFECDENGQCTVYGLNDEMAAEPPLTLELIIPSLENQTLARIKSYNHAHRSDIFPIHGSRALFGPSLIPANAETPKPQLRVENVWIATEATSHMYYSCSSDSQAGFRDPRLQLPPATAVVLFRGQCSFVDKVRSVQKIGGELAIIVDQTAWLPDEGAVSQTIAEIEHDQNRIAAFLASVHAGVEPDFGVFLGEPDQSAEPIDDVTLFSMADDGTGDDISIPSVFITKKDGLNLIKILAHCFAHEPAPCPLNLRVSAKHDAPVRLEEATFPIHALAKVGLLPRNLMHQLGAEVAGDLTSTSHVKDQERFHP